MAKQEKNQEHIGGGMEVTLTKPFTEFGITYEAGAKLTVAPDGFKKLKEGGFLDPEIKESIKP